MPRRRYALVGAGSRARMYLEAIAGTHAAAAELIAWSDTNPGRLDHYQAVLAARGLRFYGAENARRRGQGERPARGSVGDPLGRTADWRDGVRSVAVGLAGNRSLATGLPVWVSELGFGENDPLVRW